MSEQVLNGSLTVGHIGLGIVINKKQWLFVMVAVLLFNASLAAYLWITAAAKQLAMESELEAASTEELASKQAAWDADYYMARFSYNDAVHICEQEVRSRNANVIQLALNEYSTRYQADRSIYLVTFDSHIGTPMQYDEKTHTCEVDPATQGVAFYKEVFRRRSVRPMG
jgi:hypothetical protein